MKNFHYHKKDDIAVFECRDYDNYQRSIDIANFIVDLDEEGNFLGLEVLGASEQLPLTKDEIEEVEDIEFMVKSSEESMVVSVVMVNGGEKTSLNIPFEDMDVKA